MSSTKDRLSQLVDEHLDLGSNPDFDAPLRDTGMSSVEAVAFFKVGQRRIQPLSGTG